VGEGVDRRVKKSHLSSAGVKNEWSQTPSYYLHSSICLHGMHRDNSTLDEYSHVVKGINAVSTSKYISTFRKVVAPSFSG